MRPARSDSVCEHGDSRAGGARVIPTFSRRGRDQPAKRAGGRQAAGAANHRAQHARIEAYAPAHLAARQTLLVRAVADAEHCAYSLCTAVEITLSTATSKVSDMSNDLPMGRNEQLSTEHTHTAVVQAALLVRLPPEKCAGILSAGAGHRSAGALSLSEPFPISRAAEDERSWSRPTTSRPARSRRGRKRKLAPKEPQHGQARAWSQG